jgi:rubrerythrin
MDWIDFIRVMLIDEEAARAKYKRVVRMAKDPKVKRVFEQLAYEEEVHMAVLKKEEARLKELKGSK